MIATQLPLGVQLRERADFASYYAGPNRDAVAALYDLAAGQMPGVFLYGPAGQGKTHLLQATLKAGEREQRRGAYLPLAEFLALGPDTINGYESQPLLCLDDVDKVTSQRDWCISLLRLMDSRRTAALPTLISSSSGLDRLNCALPDLQSRLAALTVFGLRPLDDLNRSNFLTERMRARGLLMPAPVAQFLLARLPRDTGTLVAAVEQLDSASLSAQRRLTIPFVQRALHALLPPSTSRKAGC